MTTINQITQALMAICAGVAGAGKVFDHVIIPEKESIPQFIDAGVDTTGTINALMVHFADFHSQNIEVFAMDPGPDIYTFQLHHVRALNNQYDPNVNSAKLFKDYIEALMQAFRDRTNAHLGLNSCLVSHGPLRTYGSIMTGSDWGAWKVHYGILAIDVLNADLT